MLNPALLIVLGVIALAVALAVLRNRRTGLPLRRVDEMRPVIAFPVAYADPRPVNPNPDSWPTFETPHILGGVLPFIPECGPTYPLIYNDLFVWMGAAADAGWAAGVHGARLLQRARDQARRFCLRHFSESCQGVTELDHTISHSLFTLNGQTHINVNIVYFFRCSAPGPPVVYGPDNPPPPSIPYVPPHFDGHALCGGTYQFVAHDISELPAGCGSPNRAAVETIKTARLEAAARDHATAHCRTATDPACRLVREDGYHVSHHCFRSGPLNATYHVSTINYLFTCPMTI